MIGKREEEEGSKRRRRRREAGTRGRRRARLYRTYELKRENLASLGREDEYVFFASPEAERSKKKK